MYAFNFSKNNKIKCCLKPSTAAGTSTGQDGAEVDMAGFDSATFLFTVGATTGDATYTATVRGSTASGSGHQALSGATVTTTTGQGDGVIAIEVVKPTFRYLIPRLARNTAAGNHGGIVAIQSDARAMPTTHDSTSMLQSLVRVTYAAT